MLYVDLMRDLPNEALRHRYHNVVVSGDLVQLAPPNVQVVK